MIFTSQQLRDSISKATVARQQLFNQIISDTEQLIGQLFTELFNANPTLEMVVWEQYDGEYNDEGPYPGITLAAYRQRGENIISYDGFYNEPGIVGNINSLLGELDTDALYQLFGEYNRVVATRSGIRSSDQDLYEYMEDSVLEELYAQYS